MVKNYEDSYIEYKVNGGIKKARPILQYIMKYIMVKNEDSYIEY